MVSALLGSVVPAIGDIHGRDLTSAHIVQMVDDLKRKRGQEPARLALLYANQVLRWAVAKSLLPRNPAADIDSKVMGVRRTESQSKDRVLSREEIAALLDHLDSAKCKLDRRTALAYKILLYTGVRSGELIQADWSEIQFPRRLWAVPHRSAFSISRRFRAMTSRLMASAIIASLEEFDVGGWEG